MKRTAPVIELMRDVVVSADERLVKPEAAESLQMTAHQFTSAEALRSTLRQYGFLD